MGEQTISEHLRAEGVSRREFIRYCGVLAGSLGLTALPPGIAGSWDGGSNALLDRVVQALETTPRLPIIWLEFQDCAGCTEALTRSQSPTLVDLVLNRISIDYHETLFAAAGTRAEEARLQAMETYAGRYVLVVEGSIPTGGTGLFCTIGGRRATDILDETAAGAAAIVGTGNCAAFGGLPKASPNPTQARGVWELVTDKPVVNIPGCPAIPEVTTGTIAHYLVFGRLPELDALNRPKTFYGTTIHDRCQRRPFYDAGKFAGSFDDEGARKGYCLYKLGCKGPTTYNACATLKWDGGLSFPIQSGHPCLGCSEPDFWDGGGFYQGQSAPLDRPGLRTLGLLAGAGAVVGAGVAAATRRGRRPAPTAPTASAEEGGEP